MLHDASDPNSPWFDAAGVVDMFGDDAREWIAELERDPSEWVRGPDCTRCAFLAGLELGLSLGPHVSLAELEFSRNDAARRAENARGDRRSPARDIVEYVVEKRWGGDPPTKTRQVLERVRVIGDEGIEGSTLELVDGRWRGEARVRIDGRVVHASGSSVEKAAREKIEGLRSARSTGE